MTDPRSNSSSYKIIRRLGKGGMAEVFLARQEGLAGFRRLTVIKRLLPQFSQVSDVAEMLLDEARIAAQLAHPNIVQIFELGKDNNNYFIAMEYVDGCDLATLARIERHRNARVPLRLSLRVVAEAAMGLDYAHRQTSLDGRPLNIVHRDISPHNIMCSREGVVKVTDFGIAKAVGKVLITQLGVVKGKVQYMSPEQYTAGNVDHRSDIFSLGVVLYQLTTGKLPRAAKDGNLSVRRVIDGPIPRPSELRTNYPPELEAIVMRALAYNPEERYPDAASFREDILDFARENDQLAFPKELGDYVNTLVPPTPIFPEEQSLIETDDGFQSLEASSKSSYPTGSIPEGSVVPVNESDIDEIVSAPPSTEVASPGARRRDVSLNVTPQTPSFKSVEIPISEPSQIVERPSEQARISFENITPSGYHDPLTDSQIAHRKDDMERLTERLDLKTSAHGEFSAEDQNADHSVGTHKSVEAGAWSRGEGLKHWQHHSGLSPQSDSIDKNELDHDSSAGNHSPDIQQRSLKSREEKNIVSKRRPASHHRQEARPSSSLKRNAGTASGSSVKIITIVLVLLGIGAFIAIFGPRFFTSFGESSSQRATGSGIINVLANPSLAKVSIDGARRCTATPCQIDGLPLNRELLLTVNKKGFSIWMQRLVLTKDSPRLMIRADLSPLSKDAEKKAVAKVEDEGKPKPSGTKANEHKKHHGKKKAENTSVKGGPQVLVSDIQSEEALVAIDVQPWAEIWIDGKQKGHTPLQFSIPPGSHKVELKNPQANYQKHVAIRGIKGKKIKIADIIRPPSTEGGEGGAGAPSGASAGENGEGAPLPTGGQ